MADHRPNPPTSLEAAPAPGGAREDVLIVLPVRNLVLFPGVISPVTMNRAKTIAGAQEAVRTERPVGLLLQRDPDLDDPTPADLYPVGTVAASGRQGRRPGGATSRWSGGGGRFRVFDSQPGMPFYLARVEYL